MFTSSPEILAGERTPRTALRRRRRRSAKSNHRGCETPQGHGDDGSAECFQRSSPARMRDHLRQNRRWDMRIRLCGASWNRTSDLTLIRGAL